MIKRLAVFISILVAVILLLTTGIYFAQSKSLVTEDMNAQADIILRLKKNGIEDFQSRMSYLMYSFSGNSTLKDFFRGKAHRTEIEKLFLQYSKDMEDIQAMRLVDTNGNIRVFIREGENLSGAEGYKPINVSSKEFFLKVSTKPMREPTFSDLERGHLPDAVSFCPSMIRSMIPLFDGEEVLGYLIVNFWGSRIGETASQLDAKRGYSFITEINGRDKARDGVFIFHPDKKYEFANQFGTSFFFNKVFGNENFKILSDSDQSVIPLEDGMLFFTTYYPYHDRTRSWKICTVLYNDYFFSSLDALRHEFIAVMLFSIILSIVTAAVFSGYFMKPFAEIKQAVKEYSSGNFDYPFNPVYTGEINEIAVSIRAMSDSLKIYIENIKDTQTKMELMNRLSALGVMAGGIAHELNTPLNSIIMLAKLVKQETGDSEDIDTIEQEAKRCVDIIENLKKLAPVKDASAAFETVNLKPLMEKTVKYMTGKVRIDTELEDVVIECYPTLIQQMLINLIQNGIDASEADGVIYVGLKNDGEQALITVRDGGTGIPDDEIDHIFDPFHTTKAPNRGMGLGLSLVHQITAKHGGQINVKSRAGEGTEFTVRLGIKDESSSH